MILAMVNQKGGVAKSTSTISLGLHIARMGKKVLIIDADPQADTTRVGGPECRGVQK